MLTTGHGRVTPPFWSPHAGDPVAPTQHATYAPQAWAMAPASRPPIGADPANTVTYSDITRPRSASGIEFWIVTLIVFTISIEAKPMPATTANATDGVRTKPNAKSMTRKAAPPPRMSLTSGRWLVAKASISEPAREPAPMAANR